MGDALTQIYRPVPVVDLDIVPYAGVRWYAEGVYRRGDVVASTIKAKVLTRLLAGDIVYNRMWATKASFGVAGTEVDGCLVTNDFPIFAADPNKASPVFIKLLFLNADFQKQAAERATGTTERRRLKEADFLDLRVPLPPLPEQRRIVDLIGALDEAIEAAEQSSLAQSEALDTLATSLIFNRDFTSTKVKDVASTRGLIGGPFGSSLVSADYVADGVPIIRGTNMPAKPREYVGGPFAYVTPEKAESLRRNIAIAGDLVFTQRGTLGQVGLIPDGEYAAYVISQSQMRLRVREGVSARFVFHVFRTSRMTKYIQSRNSATANPHINLGILADVGFPLPNYEEQVAIVELLDTGLSANEATDEYATSLRTLRSNLLTVLLSGEHEIPASYDALLEVAA
jgi:type I restriction enzyme S subunit